MKYIWDPAAYSTNSPFQKAMADELVDKLELKDDESILDIGCGDGRTTSAMASRVRKGRVVGIDTSDEMISFARKTFPAADYPNLSFTLIDASKLEFNEEFDIVFSNAVLHWVKDHRPVLAGIYRALKPGGRMILQMGGKDNAALVIEATEIVMKGDSWREYFVDMTFPWYFYDNQEYLPWVVEAGLIPDSVELLYKPANYDSVEAFSGWFKTTWLPYLERVPAAKREAFVKAAIDEFLRINPPDKDGHITHDMWRLEVSAHKPY